jgi:hypothetical protein
MGLCQKNIGCPQIRSILAIANDFRHKKRAQNTPNLSPKRKTKAFNCILNYLPLSYKNTKHGSIF